VRLQKSTATSNRKQAEIIERKFKDEENAKRFSLSVERPEMTFSELMARFIAEGCAKTYHQNCLKQLAPFFEGVPIDSITKGLAGQYRQQRYQHCKAGPATVNRDISVLRRLLSWAVEQGWLMVNPLSKVKMERERRVKRPVLSVAEEERLLAVCPEHLKRLAIAALDTGMRRGELVSQLWEDVDLSRDLLSVTHSKTPEGESRELPLTGRLRELLSSLAGRSGPVFSYKSQPVYSVKRAWKTAIKNAGIRPLRFHDLRHTFNTRLMEAGVMQEIRMALMGHSTGSSVHAIYTHIELPTKRKAIAQLETWVAEERKRQNTSKEEENASPNQENQRERGSGQTGRLRQVRPQAMG